MSAKVIWIHVGLVALIAGGAAGGILYYHHAVHPRGHDAAHFLDRFRERLGLSEEQAANVESVLDGLHREMTALTKDFQEKFKTLRNRAWADIRATLSESQRPEFDKLVEEMESGHVPREDGHDAPGHPRRSGEDDE